ncbi:MAG: cyanophycin synthetase, partial [bacterium]|nr:cyanophycin synthetase [bacterium]
GKHSVYNALIAAGTAQAEGCGLEDIRKGLLLQGVRGRMEPVSRGQDFGVFVDYAHTPDGLENILRAAVDFVAGKVIVVFGCGGDRDRTKRPLMGEIAGRLADIVILTSDNPRSEQPNKIIDDIMSGIYSPACRAEIHIKEDRREAIKLGISLASKGDVVLIAGKGHENYQIFSDRTIHFDDSVEAIIALKEIGI